MSCLVPFILQSIWILSVAIYSLLGYVSRDLGFCWIPKYIDTKCSIIAKPNYYIYVSTKYRIAITSILRYNYIPLALSLEDKISLENTSIGRLLVL